jgi:hypothetical protein
MSYLGVEIITENGSNAGIPYIVQKNTRLFIFIQDAKSGEGGSCDQHNDWSGWGVGGDFGHHLNHQQDTAHGFGTERRETDVE